MKSWKFLMLGKIPGKQIFFLKTNIDKIEYTEIHNDFMWVADVTYSRLNTKDEVLSTNRSLYYFVKKDRWKIYMISSVELG
jgi:hypothetical protein